MKNLIKFLFIFVVTAISFNHVYANSANWDLSVPADYTVSDDEKIEITDGVAQLIGSVTGAIVGNYDVGGISVVDVALSSDENTAYITKQTGGLIIVDVTGPSTPTLIGEYNTSVSGSSDVVVSSDGNTAYFADGSFAILIDITTPATPTLISNYDVGTLITGLDISPDGDTLYAINGFKFGQVHAVDISVPATPTLLGTSGTVDSGKALAISPDGNYAYLTRNGNQLQVFDVSNPAAITNVGNLGGIEGSSREIVFSDDGNTAYITGGTTGLHIVNTTVPTAPVLIITFNSSGSAKGVIISTDGNTAYLADGSDGLKLVDITTPATPSLTSTLDTTGNASQLKISADEEIVYLADVAGGLVMIDLTAISYPLDSPYVTLNTGQIFTSTIDTFTQTLGATNAGTITYQVSTDDGATWKYWDGAIWTLTTAVDGSETSSQADTDTNISILDTNGGTFKWRACLNADGTQKVERSSIDMTFAAAPVVEKSSRKRSGSRRVSQERVQELFGEKQLESDDTNENQEEPSISEFEIANCTVLTQNLRAPARNGQFNSYTGTIVVEANILQKHLNRLGFNAGPVDGIMGSLTDAAIKRMQTSLGVMADGYVGPNTRNAINASCMTTTPNLANEAAIAILIQQLQEELRQLQASS